MTGFSLKDQLFNRDKVEYLAKLFAKQNAGLLSGNSSTVS